jgi:hypothetical protein
MTEIRFNAAYMAPIELTYRQWCSAFVGSQRSRLSDERGVVPIAKFSFTVKIPTLSVRF